LRSSLIKMNSLNKTIMLSAIDGLILIFVVFLSFSVRLGQWYWPEENLALVAIFSPLIAAPFFKFFGVYSYIVRYTGLSSFFIITKAVTLYAFSWGLIAYFVSANGIPRSVIFINWLLALVLLSGSRFMAMFLLSNNSDKDKKRIMIYGAGFAGRQILNALSQSGRYKVVGFFDDSLDLQGRRINDTKIYSFGDIDKLIEQHQIQEIFIAITTITATRKKEILDTINPYPILAKILPAPSELAEGKINLESFKKIEIDDLLGREPVKAKVDLLKKNISGKNVLVTGSGGSIGSELSRQILKLKPNKLILYDHSEIALYSIEQELKCDSVIPILGSTLDQELFQDVLDKFSIHTIYHAAAYKHVPMVEKNVISGLKNNVLGTLFTARLALNSNVEAFVLISSDKAVRPTNIMGASKRISELILQALSEQKKHTKFVMVRFGNVLNSSGSVIPLFRNQISRGGPITVTHKEIVRYFMTISEAVELVIQAGALAESGEVCVLNMGEPVRIVDLAKKMISLSGYSLKDKNNPDGDIEIVYTGLRPGEKLYEELLVGVNAIATEHPMILKEQENCLTLEELNKLLEQLNRSMDEYRIDQVISLVKMLVPEYQSSFD